MFVGNVRRRQEAKLPVTEQAKRLGGTGRCLHHAGSNNSRFAFVWIAPQRDLAVLCTTNIGGDGVFAKIDAVMWSVIQDHRKLQFGD